MLFNSIDFFLFLPLVFLLYWYGTKQRIHLQNILLLIASYFFYAYWDWRFLSLIAFSTSVDYVIGLQLEHTENKKHRKILLAVSLISNLGLLAFFKYFDFFLESFVDAFTLLGQPITIDRLDIILPVGISFYTFQTLSYTFDVYHRKLKPCRNAVAFFSYVSFFPQLVAGPIERASNLLPQFFQAREWQPFHFKNGLRQILWGLFQKVVIADNCARYANEVFQHHTAHTGSSLLIGAVLFSFQIYGDFAGYSNIAIGTARLFGFKLMQNFAFPYFSRDIAEFWRRWHISLSTWFRDYLYIPLGGSKGTLQQTIRNIFIIFLVSGFWHGANWKFLAWGALHACFFLPLLLMKQNRKHLNNIASHRYFPTWKELLQMMSTFLLTTIAWLFFRAEHVGQAWEMLVGILSFSLWKAPIPLPVGLWGLLIAFIGLEWCYRHQQFVLQLTHQPNTFLKSIGDILLLSIIFWAIVIWNPDQAVEFVYFQF